MCAGGGIPKSVWWNNEIKVGIKGKEAAVKEVLGARDEYASKRCLEVYKQEKRKVKRCIYIKKGDK